MTEISGGGSVELLEVFGSDLMVVRAARVSFNKETEWQEDGSISDRDARLIRYLAKHGHWTPFGQPQAQFRIKMPLFVARQWFKHQIGFIRNEVSRRYVDEEPEFWFRYGAWRSRPEDKKQGSGEHLSPVLSEGCDDLIDSLYSHSRLTYQLLLEKGVAPEQARMVLPQATMTEFIETGSLAAYARLVGLRDAPDAQAETADFARAVSGALEPRFPVSWDALVTGSELKRLPAVEGASG